MGTINHLFRDMVDSLGYGLCLDLANTLGELYIEATCAAYVLDLIACRALYATNNYQ